MRNIRFIILIICLVIQPNVWAVSATAEVRVVITWSDNPCKLKEQFPVQCQYAIDHNMFPEENAIEEDIIDPIPQQEEITPSVINYE